MKVREIRLLAGVGWTVGAYGVSQLIRLIVNIILARLLAPELFGIMLIVYSFTTGIELISNVGFNQNIVHNKKANEPDFYNTVWSLGLVRGVVLWITCTAAAWPIAQFYEVPILSSIIPIIALYFVVGSLSSLSDPLLLKKLRFAKLSAYQTILESIYAIIQIVLAYLNPTIWALVLGSLASNIVRAIGSYLLLPDLRHKFHISVPYVREIFTFGKWIFVSSCVYYFSMNFDRLYLGKVIPLELLGVYAIAQALSSPLSMLTHRIGGLIVFPLIASSVEIPRATLRSELASIHLVFLLVAAFGLSLFAAMADQIVSILYDQRYQAAGWILPVLIVGAWFSIMSNIYESTLMGLGKPQYGAFANSLKFGWLLIGLPVGFTQYGLLGAVLVVAVSDLFRYFPILFGQIRERFSFGMHDLIATFILFALIALWEWLRSALGFGTSFGGLPIGGLT